MTARRILKALFSNLAIICSIALLVIGILDWYNPYMDFLGHSRIVVYLLCASALFLGLEHLFPGKHRRGPNGRKEEWGTKKR